MSIFPFVVAIALSIAVVSLPGYLVQLHASFQQYAKVLVWRPRGRADDERRSVRPHLYSSIRHPFCVDRPFSPALFVTVTTQFPTQIRTLSPQGTVQPAHQFVSNLQSRRFEEGRGSVVQHRTVFPAPPDSRSDPEVVRQPGLHGRGDAQVPVGPRGHGPLVPPGDPPHRMRIRQVEHGVPQVVPVDHQSRPPSSSSSGGAVQPRYQQQRRRRRILDQNAVQRGRAAAGKVEPQGAEQGVHQPAQAKGEVE
mmetsp:Transcript_39245/g.118030  ORF Transcript_39245/g.118030 Transcript_39245/m.118030 type:complete len:251 (+) Transcript_39245:830-1582(+)